MTVQSAITDSFWREAGGAMDDKAEDPMRLSAQYLENPEFRQFLAALYPHGPVKPRKHNYDRNAVVATKEEKAKQRRLAQARRIIELYREWEGPRL